MIAQVVNFLLLLYILKRFLYKPLLKALEDRKSRITQSLQNAQEIEDRLNQIASEREASLKKAAAQAETIIEEAGKNAEKIIAQAHLKAQKDVVKIITKSEASLELERARLHQQIRGELADMVVAALGKVTDKVINDKEHQEMIKKSINSLES